MARKKSAATSDDAPDDATQADSAAQLTGSGAADAEVPLSVTLPETTVDDAVAEHTAEMPEVQEHAIQAAQEQIAQEKEAAPSVETPNDTPSGVPIKGKTDDVGRLFNTDIHETGPDGGPIINARGFIKKKRGGAAQKAGGSYAKAPSDKPRPASAPAASATPEQYAATGAVAATALEAIACMIGGDEFQTEKGEKDAMAMAFGKYFESQQIKDVPPGVALMTVCGFYVLKRWNRPQFTEKRQRWGSWVKEKWLKWRAKRNFRNPVVLVRPGDPANPAHAMDADHG